MDEEYYVRYVLQYAAAGLRFVVLGCMYLIVLLSSGVGFFKAVTIAAVVMGIVAIRLGRPWLQHLGVLGFVLLLVNWSGLVPVGQWCRHAVTMIDRFFS
jgi:hypothetical protein